ncbi:dynein regulatory complex subunit 7 [Schistocerca cancellata]|uniref:dynein regulatory complex subunit 7 n=1 Tax=Schistocerca cancellata TaxID=274614 RepID=UPI00211927C4|nr:dynein regulatory complex subunit 7 [Schistocerca cancellata]
MWVLFITVPDRLLSPTAVLFRQAGHCFEYSTLLCSLLIGTGYAAYVVSGYAAREFCNNDQTMVTCPRLIQPPPPEPEKQETVVSKYQVEPPPDLRSQFLIEMDRREKQRAADDERKRLEEKRRAIEEFERPPPDELHGLRLHSWILVLPPNKEVTEPFFIEPPTGNRYQVDDPHYLGIESIWNDTNYWVNLQDCSEGCKNLQFELNDNECWAHIFVGEPWFTRKETGETEGDPQHIMQEKHLDIAPSWVQRIEIPRPVFLNRYPKGQKCTFYKKAREEHFAPYVQADGLVTRITTYSDYEWEDAEVVYEYYKNRKDLLCERKHNLKTESAVEQFSRGRKDSLKEHFYYTMHMTVEDIHVIKFYNEARFDDLEKLEMHPEYLKEHFKNRSDLLYFRSTIFEPKLSYSDEAGDGRRVVKKITERFLRNPDKAPNEDVAERVFALAENEIRLRYYHGPHQITGAVREFIKPPLSERGENLTFDPDLTRGHQYDPSAPEPKNLTLYYLLDEMLKTEEKSLIHVRDIENEVDDILRTRDLETRTPKLLTSIFDRERNVEAKLAMKEKEQQKIEKQIREVEAETDYLAPYLARIGNPPTLTRQQALKIREECLSDYKQFLVDRATNIQNLFIKGSQALQAKSVWMEEERDSVTAGEEEEYLGSVNETKFHLHTLEIRLNRHRENAPLRYLQMESYLRGDKRLAVLHS